MDGRTSTRTLDVQNHASKVHLRDPFFNDLQSWSCHSFGVWVPDDENQLIQSKRQRWTPSKRSRPDWRKERERDGSVGPLSAETKVRLWCPCKDKTFDPWRLGTTQSCGLGKKSGVGKIGAELGRTISYHLQRWHWKILLRRPGWTCSIPPLECQ